MIRGGVRAIDVVSAPTGVRGILSGVVIVDDLAAAESARADLESAPADTVVVTRDGAVMTARTLRAGSGGGRSRLELAAERDAAADRLAEITVIADSLREALAEAQQKLIDVRARTKEALTTLRAHDAALAAHAEKLNRVTVRHEAAVAECERLEAGSPRPRPRSPTPSRRRGSPTRALARALEVPRPLLDASAREGMLADLETAREGEMRARLDIETLRERVRAGEARIVHSSSSANASVPPPRPPHAVP